MKTKIPIAISFISLLTGSLIYILFRTTSLRMFAWFDRLGILKPIQGFRKNITLNLPDVFLYALPDGLWMFSYISLMLFIWKNNLSYNNLLWIVTLPLLAIGSEIAQLINAVPGTFDPYDILFYLLGTLIPFFIYKQSITLKLIKI